MTAANFITARDLFLGHHWRRYPSWQEAFQSYQIGRIVGRDKEAFVLRDYRRVGEPEVRINAAELNWALDGLREPKAGEAAPPVLEVVRPGDWIGIANKKSVILFAPCLRPTGVQEADQLLEKAKSWATFLSTVRAFFLKRDFLELTTPALVVSPGTEPFLDPLLVPIEFAGFQENRYLITSPEFHLKKVLGAGSPRIFEIAKCFRNKESGHQHRVEFHMLEWYRVFADLGQIADDVEALIQVFRPGMRLYRTSMQQLFRDLLDFDLAASTSKVDLANLAQRNGFRISADYGFDDLFHMLFIQYVEPRLDEVGKGAPVLVQGYPPSQAALARIGADGFSQRFEIYWRGFELCNAFDELNDPAENQLRFDRDAFEKTASGREPMPVDRELMRTFEHGLPPAAGIALGLERLFMAVNELQSIEQARPFATFV